ncbi:MAG: YqzL family protein [Clostridia bacterium]|nr:YqzL family protein [Clostridia bacterium]
MKKDKTSNFKAREVAWKMFEKTGEISYYLLYKNLSEE